MSCKSVHLKVLFSISPILTQTSHGGTFSLKDPEQLSGKPCSACIKDGSQHLGMRYLGEDCYPEWDDQDNDTLEDTLGKPGCWRHPEVGGVTVLSTESSLLRINSTLKLVL